MSHPSRPALRKFWAKKHKLAEQARDQGIVLIQYAGSRMQVTAPFTEEFLLEAHRLGGRWRTRTGMWSFPEPVHKLVLLHLKRIYGESMINRKLEPLTDYGK